uniref:Uncharacterized protein n=1 Tax=Knipowitschia caucasica TaxID=637954 RepID=A0AAV2MAM6_KNICA
MFPNCSGHIDGSGDKVKRRTWESPLALCLAVISLPSWGMSKCAWLNNAVIRSDTALRGAQATATSVHRTPHGATEQPDRGPLPLSA